MYASEWIGPVVADRDGRRPATRGRPGRDVAQTQEARKSETRSRLLQAAADLFAEQGVDGVSVDAVAEAAGRTSGAVYAHFGSKQGLLLAVLDAWRQSALTVLSAEVALSDSPVSQLGAVWDNVGGGRSGSQATWALLEHELWLRASRDPEVATALRDRNAEGLRRSATELGRWAAAVDAHPVGTSEESAVLVRALMTGLEMQRRLEPASVPADLAVRGIAALVGLPTPAPTVIRPDRRHSTSRHSNPETTSKGQTP